MARAADLCQPPSPRPCHALPSPVARCRARPRQAEPMPRHHGALTTLTGKSTVSQSLRPAGLRPPWQPGQSGNERGANRGYRAVLALARKNSPEAMRTIIECLKEADARVRLTAATAILERAWGK